MNLREAIRLLDRFHPGFSTSLRGAGSTQISEFERRAGMKLHAEHREFLSVMGAEHPRLFNAMIGLDMRIDALIEHIESSGWRPKPPYRLIGVDANGLPVKTFLRTNASAMASEVVQFAIPGEGGVPARPDLEPELVAESLPALVISSGFSTLVCFKRGFELYARVLEPLQRDREALDVTLHQQGAISVHAGLLREEFYLADDLSVQWSQMDTNELVLFAYADDTDRLRHLAGAISVALGGKLRVEHIDPMSDVLFGQKLDALSQA